MNALNVALLSLACTLIGALIARIWALATEFTTVRGDVAKAKHDNNAIGDKVRQMELKLFYVAMMTSDEENRQEILNALVRRLS